MPRELTLELNELRQKYVFTCELVIRMYASQLKRNSVGLCHPLIQLISSVNEGSI